MMVMDFLKLMWTLNTNRNIYIGIHYIPMFTCTW